ncbi:GNAT family N-acetyltransferase [Chromobacterium sphagni]|uniref:GNAT family N-acetyltransferase n=1 Tax=Chromobacterium sphagni TaxID=1903179 RepID=UPI001EFBE429|nr:GNAT family N-acetyltransferase [Chromobacterium sphagni]
MTPADLPACYHLFGASVHGLAGACYTAEQCRAWVPLERWTDEREQSWARRLGGSWACKAVAGDGRLAGFAWLSFDGQFDMLFVAPWAGRQGVAGRMLAELESKAAAHGVTALHAWASHAARPVFERAGYQLLRANRIDRQGVALDNWLLAKGGWREPEQEETT